MQNYINKINNEIKRGVPLGQLSAVQDMKINYNPIVLVNTLFNIVDYKTNIEGYWLDDNDKLYIDNIELLEYTAIRTVEFFTKIQFLFANGEKSVFYKDVFNQGVLIYHNGTRQVLKKRIILEYTCQPCKLDIKLLLKTNKGLTVYKFANNKYLVEIYKKK